MSLRSYMPPPGLRLGNVSNTAFNAGRQLPFGSRPIPRGPTRVIQQPSVIGNRVKNGVRDLRSVSNDLNNQLTGNVNQEIGNIKNAANNAAEMTTDAIKVFKNKIIGDIVAISDNMQHYLMGSIIVSILMLVFYMMGLVNGPFLFLGLVINTIVIGVVVIKNYYKLLFLPRRIQSQIAEAARNGYSNVQNSASTEYNAVKLIKDKQLTENNMRNLSRLMDNR